MKNSDAKRFVNAYKKTGGRYSFKYLDEAILELCKKYPAHIDEEQVFAKIVLINNVYKANIQMSGRGSEWKLAKHYVKNTIDDAIFPLKNIRHFSRDTFDEIVKIHGEFIKVTKRALGRNAASFCSKYLNFHFPDVVPIYDSRADKTIWEYIGNSLDYLDYENKNNSDYAYYCAAVLELIDVLKRNDETNPSLKIIDVLLYDILYEDD